MESKWQICPAKQANGSKTSTANLDVHFPFLLHRYSRVPRGSQTKLSEILKELRVYKSLLHKRWNYILLNCGIGSVRGWEMGNPISRTESLSNQVLGKVDRSNLQSSTNQSDSIIIETEISWSLQALSYARSLPLSTVERMLSRPGLRIPHPNSSPTA